MKERRYPTYQFTVWWTLENPMTEYDNMGFGVESSTWYRQYLVPPTPEELELELNRVWLEFLTAERLGGRQPTLAERGGKLVGYSIAVREIETWYLIWFQHASLNTHLSDNDLKTSFEQFVRRHLRDHHNLGYYGNYSIEEKEETDFYCLMGAEDRWRWKEPCRCEYCQAQGIVRIDH